MTFSGLPGPSYLHSLGAGSPAYLGSVDVITRDGWSFHTVWPFTKWKFWAHRWRSFHASGDRETKLSYPLVTSNWLPFLLSQLVLGQHKTILVKNVPHLEKTLLLANPLSSFHWLPCLSLYKITVLLRTQKWLQQDLHNLFLNRVVQIWAQISI